MRKRSPITSRNYFDMTTQTLQKWEETTLGNICDEVHGVIQTGPFGSQLHESDYSTDGVPVVMPKDIIDGKIQTDDIARVSEEHVARLQKHKLKSGDIVYGRRGDIGRQALIEKEQEGYLCGTGCLKISLGEKIVNPKFLHYYLREEEVIKWIFNQAIGATMPNLNTAILRSVPVRIPDINIQKRIASVLSTYDDFIENNTRRIQILERMAQVIYAEWFIDLRFPGHEKAKLFDSGTDFGKIPVGWEVKSVTKFKCFSFFKPKINRFNGIKRYYATADIGPFGFVSEGEEVTFDSRPSRAQIQPVVNSIWFARMKDTHKISFFRNINADCADNTLLSSGMAGFRSEDNCFAFMFSMINSELFHGKKDLNATGATQISLTDSGLKQIKMVEPDIRLVLNYGSIVNPWLDEISLLLNENSVLRKTRDSLLPKLVTGKLEIKI